MRITNVILLLACLPTTGFAQKVTYDDHVKPIFRAKCFGCHNTGKKSSDLDLTSYTALMAGGASGAAVEPGAPDDSYLFSLVTHESEPYMPPNQEKIDAAQIDTIRKWIEGGALENSASKAMKKKAGPNLSLQAPANTRPEGGPPMPDVLGINPVIVPKGNTAIEAIATSPWAPLAAVSSQKQVVLYDTRNLQPLAVLPFPEGVPEVLRFSRNGKLLLAGGGRGAYLGKVVVWDVKTGERVIEIGDEVDSVLAADISSDLTLVALGGPGRVVRVFNTSDGSLNYEIKKHTDWVYDLEFSPDSVFLATADRNGGLHVWEAYSGRPYLTLNGHKGGVPSVSWRSDSNLLASGSLDGTIKLWELENGRAVKSWNAHAGGTMSVEFTRDGRVVSCGRDRVTRLWDGNGQQQRAFEAFSDLALKVSFCDETDHVIAGDWTGNIRVWNAADGKRLGELAQNPPSLEQRLAASKAALAAQEKQHAALAAAAGKAKTSVDTITAGLAGANKLLADSRAANQQAVKQVAALTKSLEGLRTQIAAATAGQKSLMMAVPQLKTAAEQIQAAAKAVPADKELAALVASLQKKHQQKTQELAAIQATLTAKTAEEKTAAAQLAAAQKLAVSTAATMKQAEADIAKLTPALKPAQEAAAKATASAQAAATALAAARADVVRWTNYLQLDQELAALQQQQQALGEKQVAAAEMESRVQAAQEAVAEATGSMTTAEAQQQAAIAEAEKLKQSLAALKAEADKAAQHAAALEAGLPQLREIVARLAETAGKVSGDPELAKAAADMARLVETKAASVAVLKKTAADKTAAAGVTALQMQEQLAKGAELAKAVAGARAKIQTMTAEMKPVLEQAESAKQAVATAEQAVDQARQVVENRKEQLRPLLGIATASNG